MQETSGEKSYQMWPAGSFKIVYLANVCQVADQDSG